MCMWLENLGLGGKYLYVAGLGEGDQKRWACYTSTVTSPAPSTLVSQRHENNPSQPSSEFSVRVSLITLCLELARWVCSHYFRCELQSDTTSLFLGVFLAPLHSLSRCQISVEMVAKRKDPILAENYKFSSPKNICPEGRRPFKTRPLVFFVELSRMCQGEWEAINPS